MEENIANSLHICHAFIENVLLPKAYKKLPPSPLQIGLFSLKCSEEVASTLVRSSEYSCDTPLASLEDEHAALNRTSTHSSQKSFIVRKPSKLQLVKQSSLFKRIREEVVVEENKPLLQIQSNELKLVPLEISDTQSVTGEQDDIETRLREMKLHQQYVRSKYAETLKENKKLTKAANKDKGKNVQGEIVYNYDGSLAASLKHEAIRYPQHYLELQVQVCESEPQHQEHSFSSKNIKSKPKAKQQPKVHFKPAKKLQIREVENQFLKDIGNIHWVDGVELKQNKEQYRKILGYNNLQSVRKKKIDLYKSSQIPVQMTLSELQSYKGFPQLDSSSSLVQGERKGDSSKSILIREQNKQGKDADRNIQIVNTRALDFLIREDYNQSQFRPKQSAFATLKKPGKSVCIAPQHLN